ncbi:hypothetical protein SteCoe_28490 [Stentor coeruleus]|uniref:TOG domain-containing protein n=1 Tax=Stentor coeruleus TaxID=5963 RepID=A0A1R2B841_9CILI|nr:hypothetical protein SteCoe_28490 [Stentor coeruleus]
MEDSLEVKYTRDINCLREKDKNVRINSIKKLTASITKEPQDQVQQLFASKLKGPVLELIKDPADKCKELSIDLISSLLKQNKILYDDIHSIITSLHGRLGIDPCQETCEEVRISEMKLILDIMSLYSNGLQPMISEITDILAKLGKDKCPQVKIQVSSAIMFICGQGLRFSSKKLLEGIRANLSHQQFKIRSCTLEAVGTLCLHESGLAEELFVDFKKTQIDRRSEVRQMAYGVMTDILTNMNYVELKKIEGKFIYLILGGLNDEECFDKNCEYLEKIFKKIRKSAEEYGENPHESLDKNWLAVRNLKEIINISLVDIQEWTIQDLYRSRAVMNIKNAILMAKDNVLPHIEPVLKVLLKAYSTSDDPKYTEAIEAVPQVLSQVCSFKESLEILDKVITESLASSEKAAGLSLLSKMLPFQNYNIESLKLVMDFIQSKDFLSDTHLYIALHKIAFSLLNSFAEFIKPYVHEIFFMLLTIENTLKNSVYPTMEILTQACGLQNVGYLYSLQLPNTLPKIITNYKKWESHSSERTQFRNLITRSQQGIKEYWEDVLSVIIENCAREKDSEVRYDMLICFETILDTEELKENVWKSGKRVIIDIISTTSAWKVGASSVQIRISSLICCKKLLNYKGVSAGIINDAWECFFGGIKGCMDDDWDNELRLSAIQCVIPLLEQYGNELTIKNVEETLKELMKRLDDSVNFIRALTTYPIRLALQVFISLNQEYEALNKNIRVLFLHLDDENNELQHGVFIILQQILAWRPQLVIDIAQEKRPKQLHPERIDSLLSGNI